MIERVNKRPFLALADLEMTVIIAMIRKTKVRQVVSRKSVLNTELEKEAVKNTRGQFEEHNERVACVYSSSRFIFGQQGNNGRGHAMVTGLGSR